jgi:polyphosphate kinase
MVEILSTPLPRLRLPLLLLAFLAFPSAVRAHRLDEYLQATLVAIEPNLVRLQINLTPGVSVADQILARIDRDGDANISKKEAAAYAETLKRDLTLHLDGRKLILKLSDTAFPTIAELRAGSGIIQLEFAAMLGALTTGPHKLEFANRHMLSVSVYLINATHPNSSRIKINSQNRTPIQDTGTIEFTLLPQAK